MRTVGFTSDLLETVPRRFRYDLVYYFYNFEFNLLRYRRETSYRVNVRYSLSFERCAQGYVDSRSSYSFYNQPKITIE